MHGRCRGRADEMQREGETCLAVRFEKVQGRYREGTGKVQGRYRERHAWRFDSTGKVQGRYREGTGKVQGETCLAVRFETS
jgi:uncharacterized protein YjbJ (UPF0337 family)